MDTNEDKILYKDLYLQNSWVGHGSAQQTPISVYFGGEVVGDYYADILIDKKLILELKVAGSIADVHRAQTLNYLKATVLRLAMILNFGKERLEYERLVK